MSEDRVERGIWAGWLPYYEPPRLRSSSGPARFSSPHSLGLTADLEERLRRWNDDWRRGFVDYSSDGRDAGSGLELPGYGYGVPRWSDGVKPAAWYGEGRAIAAQLADELAGVKVSLAAIRYVCAPQFLTLTRISTTTSFLHAR